MICSVKWADQSGNSKSLLSINVLLFSHAAIVLFEPDDFLLFSIWRDVESLDYSEAKRENICYLFTIKKTLNIQI